MQPQLGSTKQGLLAHRAPPVTTGESQFRRSHRVHQYSPTNVHHSPLSAQQSPSRELFLTYSTELASSPPRRNDSQVLALFPDHDTVMACASGTREGTPPLEAFRPRIEPSPSPGPDSVFSRSPSRIAEATAIDQANPLHSPANAIRSNGAPLPTTPTLDSAASGTESLGLAFICSFHGCTGRAFETQALLDSHAVVRSSTRPFHCTAKDCPRSFKRKNDLVKHAWVHNSLGYSCPFCTDPKREYYRPDNLQRLVTCTFYAPHVSASDSTGRHLRSHHADKGKDDTTLLQVLLRQRGRSQKGVGNPRISSDVLLSCL